MNPLEAFADAIMHHEGWYPGSHSYRNRNPGNLRPFDTVTQQADPGGYRIFDSFVEGYAALLSDIRAKFLGTHHLGPTASVSDLFNVYAPSEDHNDPASYCGAVLHWVNISLGTKFRSNTLLGNIWSPDKIAGVKSV